MMAKKQSFSQVIISIELCITLQLYYKVSLISVKTNLYFWLCSYCNQPLLRKKSTKIKPNPGLKKTTDNYELMLCVAIEETSLF